MIGCGNSHDQRLLEMAQRHQQQQVEQNLAAAELQEQVAEGTKRIVESEAKARQEFASTHEQLQSERSLIGKQRDELETERRQIANQRRFDSLMAVAIVNSGLLLACLLPLVLAWQLLRQPSASAENQEIIEAMIGDLVSSQPKLLPNREPCDGPADAQPRLPKA